MKTPWQRATPVMFCLQVGVSESLVIEKGPGAPSTEVKKGELKRLWWRYVPLATYCCFPVRTPEHLCQVENVDMNIFICWSITDGNTWARTCRVASVVLALPRFFPKINIDLHFATDYPAIPYFLTLNCLVLGLISFNLWNQIFTGLLSIVGRSPKRLLLEVIRSFFLLKFLKAVAL